MSRHDANPGGWRRYIRFWRPDVANDVSDELDFHLDMRARDYARDGASPDEALTLARQRLGDLDSVSAWLRVHDDRQLRSAERKASMSDLWQDLRLALRQLRRAPGFTFIAVATLGLAIGATTAVMSVVDSVLLRPLPFVNPGELVQLQPFDKSGGSDDISPLDFLDLQRGTSAFAALVPIQAERNTNLVRPGHDALRVSEARVGAGFFDMLGVGAIRGRVFHRGEDSAATGNVVVLSHGAWERLFGGDSGVIGTRVQLAGRSYQLIGVADPQLTFPGHPDIWVPMVWEAWETQVDNRGLRELSVIGRLKHGMTLERGRSDLARTMALLAASYPNSDQGYRISAEPLGSTLVGDVRTPLFALLGAVFLVLMIACANVANLLLVRGSTRRGEFALRTALGAGRGRLIRQLLTESVLLAGAGAVVGAMLSFVLVRLAVLFGPADLPRADEIHVRLGVLGVTAAIALIVGIGFGLLPAMHTVTGSLSRSLRENGRGADRGGHGVREVFVVLEIGLALVLLVGAGLLLRSFEHLLAVDTGFQSDRVIGFDIGVSGPRYQDDIGTRRFTDDVLRGLRRLPGTQAVAVAAERPFDSQASFNATTSFTITGWPPVAPSDEPRTRILPVSADYFRTLRIRLERGRTFTAAEEGPKVPPVVIVNRALVRRYFAGTDPIGQELVLGISHHIDASPADSFRSRGTIVGIAADVKLDSLSGDAPPTVYVGYGTLPGDVSMLIRTAGDPARLFPGVRAAVHAADPDATIYSYGTLHDDVAASAVRPRFYALILTAFATIALVIAALGIYGVLSYTVAQRTRELGIRMALGASAGVVVRSVLRGALSLTAIGLIIGVAGAAAATRALGSMLFGVGPLDPAIVAASVIVLFGMAVLAAWLPARRAARVDPNVALRGE
ncbi:MAG TPA: ABC transporter permease [Gemmatimonadales bacterium]|jgi:predicted permease